MHFRKDQDTPQLVQRLNFILKEHEHRLKWSHRSQAGAQSSNLNNMSDPLLVETRLDILLSVRGDGFSVQVGRVAHKIGFLAV